MRRIGTTNIISITTITTAITTTTIIIAGRRSFPRGFPAGKALGKLRGSSGSINIPTAPRIPPHHPAQRDERKGVMSLVGQLLESLSFLVAKLFSVLGCSLVE